MPTEKLKSDQAKEKHGELMLAVARAIFASLFPALFGLVALQMIVSTDMSTFLTYLLLSFIGGGIGLYLMIEGLKRIDAVHVNRQLLKAVAIPSIEKMPDGGNELNIAINHGNTQITICIK